MKTPRDILDDALGDACVQLGFCSMPIEKRKELASRQSLTSREFADAVVEGDGLVPAYEKKHVRSLMRCFERRFGSSEVRLR